MNSLSKYELSTATIQPDETQNLWYIDESLRFLTAHYLPDWVVSILLKHWTMVPFMMQVASVKHGFGMHEFI